MCVIIAYGVQCLIAGCRGSGAGQQGVRPGRGMLDDVQHPSRTGPTRQTDIIDLHSDYVGSKLSYEFVMA